MAKTPKSSKVSCGWICRSRILVFLLLVQVFLICCFFGLHGVLPHHNGCSTPKSTEGYMVQEHQLHREDFYVEVHCAEGYHGRAKALPCLHLSQPYKLTGCHKGIDIEHVHREKKEKTPIVTGPPGKYHLDLRLPEDILSQKSLKEQKAMFKQYGFNLKKSNEMGLVRPTRDLRNAQCQARQYPEVSALPKASVIIIFFNEALSTLLRNVMMVFNLTPEELLGEVLLVDDHSDLEELKLLPEHLERLKGIVPPEKVRLVHRDSHDGIVAARNLGAKVARFPVIVILDSHAEVTVGWLEPLLARIHEDRKRVVVPNIVAIDIHNLDFLGGNGAWPPVRGIFKWRLTFIGAAADMDSDLLEKDVDKKASVWRSPVMPGGLFAMDREYYWELGGYDPEIRYYGAEHVEMSFRIWMCGGTLEVNPCSNIGHIYREFDRFGVDRQLKSDIGKVLDRNDARVADVWMDEYKELFFKYRNMKKADLGPQMESRHQLREKLQCKSFEWFLKEVCRDLYIPDEDTEIGKFLSVHTSQCITGGHDSQGPVHFDSCNSNAGELQVEWTSRNYIQISPHVNHHLVCLRTQIMAQVPCNKGTKWKMEGKQLRSLDRKGSCLTRSPSGEALDLVNCKDVRLQQWLFQNPGTLSGPDKDLCIDNMQRSSGPPGLYGCHGGNTQRWQLDDQQRLRSGEGSAAICLGFDPSVSIASCAPDDVAFEWIRRTSNHKDTLGFQTFSPVVSPEKCLVAKGAVATLESCKGKAQQKISGGNPSEPLTWTSTPRVVNDVARLAEELHQARSAAMHQTRMEVHRAEAIGALESQVAALNLRLEEVFARLNEVELGIDTTGRGGVALRLRFEQMQSSVELRLTSLAADMADVCTRQHAMERGLKNEVREPLQADLWERTRRMR